MIKITNLKKQFKVYKNKRRRLKGLLGIAKQKIDYDFVESLKGINLEVPSGKVHGLIGMNGAGKSTLLKLLTGVLTPTSGTIEMKGRVSALLELGTGFHPELTGRENIFLNGRIIGFSTEQVEVKIKEIEEFSELGDFFDRPVKVYSSGMYVRLAFAFAVTVEPDILIIDEALSVGDAYFQQKCLDKINEFKKKNTTILFVSHDLAAVKILCDSVSLLSHGEIVYTGEPLHALELYNALLAEHQKISHNRVDELSTTTHKTGTLSGNKKVEITEIVLSDLNDKALLAVVSGELVRIKIKAKVNKSVDECTCGILIRDRLGYDVFGTNSFILNQEVKSLRVGEVVEYSFEMKLNLGAGDYQISPSLHSGATHLSDNYDWRDRGLIFKVLPDHKFNFIGVSRLDLDLRVTRI